MNVINYDGRVIVGVLHASYLFQSYGHWTLTARFVTDDGGTLMLSAITTDSRFIDDWKDAAAEDDAELLAACRDRAVNIILSSHKLL